MKRILVASSVVLTLCSALTVHADLLADWTFETSASTNNIIATGKTPAASQSGVLADIGTGTGSASHATSSTWTIPAGNGSGHSWSVQNWAANDFYQFAVSTIGFSGITLSYDQTGSATGPSHFYLSYSTDGSSYTVFGGTNSLLVNAAPNFTWNVTTPTNGYNFAYDLSTVTALNNASTVFFRVTDADTVSLNGGTVAAGGTDRIDNFIVNASPIPEPSTFAMALVGFAVLTTSVLRHRRSS